MRIEVDTKHDSKEDIKKVIKMLTHLVENSAVFSEFAQVSSTQSTTPQSYDSFPGLGFMDSSSAPSDTSSSSTAQGSSSSGSSTNHSQTEAQDKDFDFNDLETF